MKILVIVSRIPYPLEKGDKLRAFHQVRELSKQHEVCLCCLSDDKAHPDALQKLNAIAAEVHIISLSRGLIYLNMLWAWLGRKPFQVAYFYQRSAHQKIKSIIRSFKPDHIYCQLIRTTEYAKNEHSIPKTLDYQDAFSKGMARRAEKEKWWFMRRFFKTESRRLLIYEHLIFDFFEHKCIISEQDKSLIYHEKQKEIVVIPNGVDFDFFQPQPEVKREYDLCFVGNMSYAPNIDSALYLAHHVLPKLKQEKPEISLLIAGANPVPSIQELASENIEVMGWVDDIRDAYAQSRIFIAPMQIGTGLQNKLLEAMAMSLPCITSKLANNALGAAAGKHILIGKQSEDYAHHVLYLLNNPDQAIALAKSGREFVINRYSWSRSTQQLAELMSPSV